MKQILITGTDTEVGKTIVTSCLAARLQKYSPQTSGGILKLMETGVGDSQVYQKLFPNLEIVAPLSFETPIAPPLAAIKEGKTVDLKLVWETYCKLQQKHQVLLIEALGGLGSPITNELTVADLARDWKLPTILVVPVKLGAIAATVANLALARQNKIKIVGVILNCVNPDSEANLDDLTPIALVENLTQVRVLGVVPYLADTRDLDQLAQIGSHFDLNIT
jgi:dethiobiotin synthetase